MGTSTRARVKRKRTKRQGRGEEQRERNGTYEIGMIGALEDLHLAPHAPFVPLDIFF